MTTFHFFEDAVTHIDQSLTSYVSDTASNVISTITPSVTSLLIIYVMAWGWMLMRGMIQEAFLDGISRVFRLSIIIGLALSLGRYNEFVADFFWQLPDALAKMVVSGYQAGSSNIQFLDTLMGKLYDFGSLFWEKANSTGGWIPDLGLLLVAIVIWIIGLAVTAYACFLLILSKMSLAVLLGLGPLFLLALTFEATRKFFDAWIGQVLNFAVTVLLTASIMSLILKILQTYLDVANPDGQKLDPAVPNAFPALALCVIGLLILIQVAPIASALAGGVAVSSLGTVGSVLTSAKRTVGNFRPSQIQKNGRRAFEGPQADVRALSRAAVVPAQGAKAIYTKITRSRGNRVGKN
jgi:type IV secretion system protein VirB6